MTIHTNISQDEKVVCQICGGDHHSIQLHLAKEHPEYTLERYQREYPDAPVLSAWAEAQIERRRVEKEKASQMQANLTAQAPAVREMSKKAAPLHETFGLPLNAATKNKMGNPISVTVLEDHGLGDMLYLPETDSSYVFNIDLLKTVIMGFELNMPTYLWGFHGTGKTTVLQQASARLKRPFIRVQHSINMQESEVLGQWTVRTRMVEQDMVGTDGKIQKSSVPVSETFFQLGPLAQAMINGWVYCADEYDTALPAVITLYQPVMEGQPLLIKDAPPEFRKIIPHPQFRFVATGNTNGGGDESGLYQGTLVQNAANYSRFGITKEVEYMDEKIETSIIVSKTSIPKDDAQSIVKFANSVRKLFKENGLSTTVSPRELINAANLGRAFGGNFREGLMLAFGNRLNSVDKKAVGDFLQRIYG